MKSQVLKCFLVGLIGLTSLVVSQTSFAQVAASPEHAVLKYEVGVWDMVSVMETPDGKVEFSGVETNTMIGDMWVSSTLVYEVAGQEMAGHGVFGYDPNKKKYIGTWHDAASPYRSDMEGTWNEETKTFVYDMKGRDPGTGNEQNGKVTIKYDGDDKKVFKMQIENPADKSQLIDYFSMTYTKRK